MGVNDQGLLSPGDGLSSGFGGILGSWPPPDPDQAVGALGLFAPRPAPGAQGGAPGALGLFGPLPDPGYGGILGGLDPQTGPGTWSQRGSWALNGAGQGSPLARPQPDSSAPLVDSAAKATNGPPIVQASTAAGPASSMRLSPAGAAFIKSWEQGPRGGPATAPYSSPEGGADTIGWGHKLQPSENFANGIAPAQADQLFDADSNQHQAIVQKHVKAPLTQSQYDALVSLTYNSPKALTRSHLLDLLNSGDYAGAAAQFGRWNHANRQIVPGLTMRRSGEKNIFSSGAYENH